jgi:hypothetical protein
MSTEAVAKSALTPRLIDSTPQGVESAMKIGERQGSWNKERKVKTLTKVMHLLLHVWKVQRCEVCHAENVSNVTLGDTFLEISPL